MTDLSDLDGFAEEFDNNVTAPIALFFLNKNKDLIPIAIQLFQDSDDDNPVFTPDDDKNTWLLAKFYYNLGEAIHHQSTTHLGHTHFLMEPIIICAHRNLAPSHPVHRILAPHFLYTLAINRVAYASFFKKGDLVDRAMSSGGPGTLHLIGKAVYNWRFRRDATIENLFVEHNVTKKDLPYYPFRDDVTDLYHAIQKYVSKILMFYYDKKNIKDDDEIKAFRLELTRSISKGGLGLKDFPGSDETGFSCVEEVIETVTGLIFTASVKHAAVNFQTYDTVAYPPNYPLYLSGELPVDKRKRSEEEIVGHMPNRNTALDILLVARFLSYRDTNSLGNFEIPKLYNPVAVAAHTEFMADLQKISSEIKRKSKDKTERPWSYPWTDPEIIPNAISA